MRKKLAKLEKQLSATFARWEHLKQFGGSDPFWEDGMNMNLVRNHILNYKREIKDICDQAGLPLPSIYNAEPPEVDPKYMARVEEIKLNAQKSLLSYDSDENFKKLEGVTGITDKQKAQIIKNILGYRDGLRQAITAGDLIAMRRHENPSRYLESAKNMVAELETVEEITESTTIGQMSLFDYLTE